MGLAKSLTLKVNIKNVKENKIYYVIKCVDKFWC